MLTRLYLVKAGQRQAVLRFGFMNAGFVIGLLGFLPMRLRFVECPDGAEHHQARE